MNATGEGDLKVSIHVRLDQTDDLMDIVTIRLLNLVSIHVRLDQTDDHSTESYHFCTK